MLSDAVHASTRPAPTAEHDAAYRQEIIPQLDFVFHFARKWTRGNDSAAEDLAQVVAMKAWKYRDRYVAGSNPRAWLSTLLRNEAIRAYTRSLKSSTAQLFDSADGDTALDHQAIDAHLDFEVVLDERRDRQAQAAIVNEALRELTPDHRDILLARDIDGLSYAELGVRLGIQRKGTVMSRLHRARAALASAVERRQAAA